MTRTRTSCRWDGKRIPDNPCDAVNSTRNPADQEWKKPRQRHDDRVGDRKWNSVEVYGPLRAWQPVDRRHPCRSWLVLARMQSFTAKPGPWHEVHPIIVELGQKGHAPMMIFVSGSEWVRSVEDLVVVEWAGPLRSPG